MARSFPALALILAATPLLHGCHKASSGSDWAASFGGDGTIKPHIALDPTTGAVALAGDFQNDLDLGLGTLTGSPFDDDIFVGMFDEHGHTQWSGATGSAGLQEAVAVAFDPQGDVVLLGDFGDEVSFGDKKLTALTQDGFLTKFDASGNAKWVKHWSGDDGGPSGSGSFAPSSLVVGANGDITFGGSFTGSIGFGGPPLDTGSSFASTSFVARVDRDGKYLWSRAFGGQSNAVGAVAVDAQGSVYVSGLDSYQLEIGGGKFESSFGNGFVARLASDGKPMWAFQLGGEGNSYCGWITVGESGDVFIAGTYAGTLEAGNEKLTSSDAQSSFVLAVGGDGKVKWLHDFHAGVLSGIALDGSGRVVVGGSYVGGNADFGGGTLPELDLGGAFISTLEPVKGKHVGTMVLGVPDQPSAITGIAVSGNEAVVTGIFSGSLQLPSGPINEATANGFGSAFLARIGL